MQKRRGILEVSVRSGETGNGDMAYKYSILIMYIFRMYTLTR